MNKTILGVIDVVLELNKLCEGTPKFYRCEVSDLGMTYIEGKWHGEYEQQSRINFIKQLFFNLNTEKDFKEVLAHVQEELIKCRSMN